ncbi:hypothetical protein [Cellulomonas dongxiuzhuiae]|uniref:Uncharacterized protein n=1 Tax=Cellulomonas dongxiuzhuiae TaxID=2819979 RepID=A0ABX8GKL6_9CELL|nr:hypothetical protein [Cellulomonas dongxiuzhuiae]MBO3089564.1 hypothetical protein [Cellulomonas dongxiuzhuiae]MBO3095200.1 hypothetical protein [Cellulomonas dongxiuzhuiae]QWC16201.1 hypothetical protein KKR89_00500 [Cellulomonas dongxiuzhuiae]
MTDHAEHDGRHDAVRAAHAAWLSPGDPDPFVLEAVQDGLLRVPVAAPTSSWFGLPHQRTSRESATLLRRRRR